MTELLLDACRPEPIGSYLKALGILRVVAEQADPAATGTWRGDRFVLSSILDADGLARFLLDDYQPTPVITPWNGGSGFFPKDNHDGIEAIEASDTLRFETYRTAIARGRALLQRAGIEDKPDKKDKPRLLVSLRSSLPEEAIAWFDAAVVLAGDELAFPPLLGTGGNDGRLDFANNQMRRLAELFVEGGRSEAEALLYSSLHGTACPSLSKAAIGQFDPSGAGGANRTAGFDAASLVNPWDYVLLVEGALLLAASVSRKLESAAPGVLAYPFMVRATGAGYGSAAVADEGDSRNELWLPWWSRPATLPELRSLFGEGRATLPGHRAGKAAVDAVDFARAVASLGVDRGIDGFVRYGFHVRNGLAYFAVPLGRWRVGRRDGVDLVADLEMWLARLRTTSRGRNAAASLVRAARQVDETLLAFCERSNPDTALAFLIAVADAEAVAASSPKHREKIPPVPPLRRAWLRVVDDGSVELRLAVTLSSRGIKRRLVPIDPRRPERWAAQPGRSTTWGPGSMVDNLARVLLREEVEGDASSVGPSSEPRSARRVADLSDLTQFIEGRVDDRRLDALVRGLSLIGWQNAQPGTPRPRRGFRPPASFALLALAHHRPTIDGQPLPRTTGLLRRALSGDGRAALVLATYRLRAAGLALDCHPFAPPDHRVRREVAALAFPLDDRALARLRRQLAVTTTDSSRGDS